MNNEKIAILIDSCTDVPIKQINQYGMYVIPLRIVYKDKTYTDGVDITADKIYDDLKKEIPSTSLPVGEDIIKVFDKIKADGYEKVIAITISSGLSGTFNFIRLLSEEYEGLEFFMVDTKNIGIASGMNAILAAENLESGMSWEEIKTTTINNIKNSKIFFCVATLEYLRKGGRIGLVASLLGESLNIRPIISCNEDGVYYNAGKTMGRKKNIQMAMDLAEKFANTSKACNIAIVHGYAKEEAQYIKETLIQKLKGIKEIFEGQISPVLGVHTGPGLIGICVQLIKE